MSNLATHCLAEPDVLADPAHRIIAYSAPNPERGRPVAWLPWIQPGTPMTTLGERQFLADLEWSARGATLGHTRRDVTAVLNGLRGGIEVDDLLRRAPGLSAERLYGAYLDLDARRSDAHNAWKAIVSSRSRAGLLRHGSSAARLLPVAVDELRRAAQHGSDALGAEIDRAELRIGHAGEFVARLEDELDRCEARTERAHSVGEQLYNPYETSMYFDSWFLPTRVGAIVPTRVAALLGERTS